MGKGADRESKRAETPCSSDFKKSLKELAPHPTGQVSLNPSSKALLATPKQTLSIVLFPALENFQFPTFSSFALWKKKYVTQGLFRGLISERASIL